MSTGVIDINQSGDNFDFASCNSCGKCMRVCPPAQLSGIEPVAQIEELKQTHYLNNPIVSKCIGCFLCDSACPEGSCRTYSLVRQHWRNRHRAEGIPRKASFFLPHRPSNFRSAVHLSMPEKLRLAEWDSNTRKRLDNRDVLYTGCNLLLLSGLVDSPLFEDLLPAGNFRLCCGEMYFRMGLSHLAEESGKRLDDWVKKVNPARLVVACPGCYSMLTGILPERFNIEIGVPVIFILDWLATQMDPNTLKTNSHHHDKIVIQNPCHSVLDPEVLKKKPALFLESAGVEVFSPSNRNGGCCGIGAASAEFSVKRVLTVARQRWSELRQVEPNAPIVTTCGGCLLTLTACSTGGFGDGGLIHILEFISDLAGYPVQTNVKSNVRSMLWHMAPHVFKRRRFKALSLEALESED